MGIQNTLTGFSLIGLLQISGLHTSFDGSGFHVNGKCYKYVRDQLIKLLNEATSQNFVVQYTVLSSSVLSSSWFSTTWQSGHVVGQYNTQIWQNIYKAKSIKKCKK